LCEDLEYALLHTEIPVTYHELKRFLPEYLDFQRGIRIGHLEPHQRITRILKQKLEERYGEAFVTDRYGRGVYWQWICFLSRANRAAKPFSHHTNFGCSKFFISIDRKEALFQTGMQVERGYLKAPSDRESWQLQKDWDWHLLVEALEQDDQFSRRLRRLMKKEGFQLKVGSWENPSRFVGSHNPSPGQLLEILYTIPAKQWGGFQLYYPMSPAEVEQSTGPDLVDAMMAVFQEVTPQMNGCIQIQLKAGDKKLK
jgi:hypothetical protein